MDKSSGLDRISIYQKLVAIKPFFQDVEKIKAKRRSEAKAYETGRSATLVAHGGVLVEHSGITGGGIPAPLLVPY